ncbi:hypothetical protein B0T17DRAFT_541595 [Bombardia bombarda]|uniref:ABM domain-containing protein n=1 Tax=Bombardia bombarda TaxID=252184 RepID=A0AA40BVR6_9PEZI|nr:hypothetical protein B0T17DRAFT_541595 [Bombardia bombarda]
MTTPPFSPFHSSQSIRIQSIFTISHIPVSNEIQPITIMSVPPVDPAVFALKAFTLRVKVRVAPENAPKFLEAFKVVFDEVTSNPECEDFNLYQDAAKPGEFQWVENWNAPVSWLFEQFETPTFKNYLAITEPLFLEPREFSILQKTEVSYFKKN